MNYVNIFRTAVAFTIDALLVYILGSEAKDIYQKKARTQTAPTTASQTTDGD